jgi:mono/diheme cytochrome c family protein
MRIAIVLVVTFSAAASLHMGAQQPSPTRSVWTGVYTAEQAKRGAPVYGDNCGSCHGTALEGGEMAPPLAGGQFNSNWSGLSMGDLFERLRISMPANSPGSLSRQQYVDVLAFMLSRGSFPEGKTELPRETEVLRQISFEANKP